MRRSASLGRDVSGEVDVVGEAGVGKALARVSSRLVDRWRDRTLTPEPYVEGETRIARLMTWPAISGFVGASLILWGASQPTSPFTLNQTSGTLPGPLQSDWHPWFFGTGPLPAHAPNVLFGVVAVYGGMFLMIRAWIGLIHMTRLHPGIPLRRLVPVFAAWMLPLLFVAPLFSHDAYSYVAQGEEVSHHINPYIYSPSILGVGGNPFASMVDQYWYHATSPYGPVFMWLAGAVLEIGRHDELAALVGFRVLAVIGTGLLAFFAPRLAASYGRDPAKAFVLVALNPLVLLHLVAGEHNDALMIGLLVAGLALARERHPLIGIVVCTFAALVKVPALIGVLYIGWDWRGAGVPIRRRVAPTAAALGISAAIMTAMTWLVGLGWGWVSSLVNPYAITSWMDPAIGAANLVGKLVSLVGLGQHTAGSIVVMKIAAGVIGVAVAVWLLLSTARAGRADQALSLRAIGLTLVVAVVCSPVVQPWYFVWGVVLLAPIAEKRLRVAVVGVSVVMAFLGLPGGKRFVTQLGQADPFAVASAVAGLLIIAGLLFGPAIRSALTDRRVLMAAGSDPSAELRPALAAADAGDS